MRPMQKAQLLTFSPTDAAAQPRPMENRSNLGGTRMGIGQLFTSGSRRILRSSTSQASL